MDEVLFPNVMTGPRFVIFSTGSSWENTTYCTHIFESSCPFIYSPGYYAESMSQLALMVRGPELDTYLLFWTQNS